MGAKSDALSLLMRARDEWAAGDEVHALELLDAASVRLEQSGFTRADMPETFALIERIRVCLLGNVMLSEAEGRWSMSRAFDNLVSTWTFCEDEDRDAFIAYLRICGYAITRQIRGNGPDLPDETATEKQAACMSRSDELQKPAGPSRPVTAPEPSTASPEARATIPSPAVYAGADGHRSIPRTDAREAGLADSFRSAVANSQSVQAVSNSQSDAPLGVSTGPDGRPADKSPVAHFTAHGLNPDGVA